MNILNELFSNPPEFNEEQMSEFRASGKWYNYYIQWLDYLTVSLIRFSSIKQISDIIKPCSQINYGLIVGQMYRISKLTLQYIDLASKRKYVDTTNILYRTIWEASVTLQWILTDLDIRIEYYKSSSLHNDLKLKEIIESNIKKSNGKITKIERRMLRSIESTLTTSGLDTTRYTRKKMPHFLEMLKEQNENWEQVYNLYGITSNNIHGTFTEIVLHYLTKNNDGSYSIKTDNMRTDVGHVIWLTNHIFQVIKHFVDWSFTESDHKEDVSDVLDGIGYEIFSNIQSVFSKDSELAD